MRLGRSRCKSPKITKIRTVEVVKIILSWNKQFISTVTTAKTTIETIQQTTLMSKMTVTTRTTTITTTTTMTITITITTTRTKTKTRTTKTQS